MQPHAMVEEAYRVAILDVPSAAGIACAKSVCRYIYETYGRFPASVDAMHLMWFMQAQMIAVPVIPPEMPSALLERRPDIAAVERLMAAANAQIGVTVAAFFPTITLSGNYGTSAVLLHRLLATSSRFWSFGSNLVQTNSTPARAAPKSSRPARFLTKMSRTTGRVS